MIVKVAHRCLGMEVLKAIVEFDPKAEFRGSQFQERAVMEVKTTMTEAQVKRLKGVEDAFTFEDDFRSVGTTVNELPY